jgi:hypothetical protein
MLGRPDATPHLCLGLPNPAVHNWVGSPGLRMRADLATALKITSLPPE